VPKPVDVAGSLQKEVLQVVIEMIRAVLDDLVANRLAMGGWRRIKCADGMIEVEHLSFSHEPRGFESGRFAQEVECPEVVRWPEDLPGGSRWSVLPL
jgi:hypothetical protein